MTRFLTALAIVFITTFGVRAEDAEIDEPQDPAPAQFDLNGVKDPFLSKLPAVTKVAEIKEAPASQASFMPAMVSSPTAASTSAPRNNVAVPEVQLEGIVRSDDGGYVIIKGEVYGIGEEVAGLKIVKITRDGVEMVHKNRRIHVAMDR